ncbi:hypothetical protein [Staphylococcus pettenkoferi]|uniref:hypothetical protein n=1 Tax=Staphylococcus pettenkoferi TaxID=170573 RepID=UPI0011AA5009|nr:hypothetical protein [Staphylococcus pettenkoferi]
MVKKYDKESLIGTKKGIYTLVENIDEKNSLFKCELCGKIYKSSFYSWYHRGRKVCDCMFKNTHHKLYGRYDKMLYRCYNKNSYSYKYYGGRGIKVCERWKENFDNFLEDMLPTFFEGAELDRIDNDDDYKPSNCRWVSHSHNMLNRKSFKNKTNFPGVKKNSNKYYGRVQINKVSYSTKQCDTPKKAYEELQLLKQRLYSEMNISKPL